MKNQFIAIKGSQSIFHFVMDWLQLSETHSDSETDTIKSTNSSPTLTIISANEINKNLLAQKLIAFLSKTRTNKPSTKYSAKSVQTPTLETIQKIIRELDQLKQYAHKGFVKFQIKD